MIQSLRKLCEEPDCTFSENCVVWTATWVITPINVVSSPLPSFLLYFLFVEASFLKRVSLCHFYNVFFHNVENTFEKWEHKNLLFVVKKKDSLFAPIIVETSSRDFHFCWLIKKKFYSPFFANLLRKFFSKKIWQKQSFCFSGGSSFSHFSILFHLRKAFMRTKHLFH